MQPLTELRCRSRGVGKNTLASLCSCLVSPALPPSGEMQPETRDQWGPGDAAYRVRIEKGGEWIWRRATGEWLPRSPSRPTRNTHLHPTAFSWSKTVLPQKYFMGSACMSRERSVYKFTCETLDQHT